VHYDTFASAQTFIHVLHLSACVHFADHDDAGALYAYANRYERHRPSRHTPWQELAGHHKSGKSHQERQRLLGNPLVPTDAAAPHRWWFSQSLEERSSQQTEECLDASSDVVAAGGGARDR